MKTIVTSVFFILSMDIFRLYNVFEHRMILAAQKKTYGKHSEFSKENGTRVAYTCYLNGITEGYVSQPF